MTKLIVGISLGLIIGAACRWFDIPVPSPPKLAGALLIAAITVGYMGTDKLIVSRFSAKGLSSTRERCAADRQDKPFLEENLSSNSQRNKGVLR